MARHDDLPGVKEVEHYFTYHPPTGPVQLEAYRVIREYGKILALAIWNHSPPGADRSAAIRKVREAVMTANQAIACGETPAGDKT